MALSTSDIQSTNNNNNCLFDRSSTPPPPTESHKEPICPGAPKKKRIEIQRRNTAISRILFQ
ncbi:hypothetical protein PPL_02061 [Heterostelium album PN500]|uniref:Uncharacterized protein n=1 Tax=Heterostelium pallidum (strain ATCC 26659 / Pp 5 / PN500) TaxID=670386 RepID=D3B190_HETP5|nr:hypothetical protein PPL_02061 [Heterostelium album PN500]EFA85064.1 hypothetical protein PPL_02061 [Heterostelium album PN500]|eukprot:XP_020437174.1 hypothetical protein PPL_02061 [Heterostelium album PN500]